MIGAKTPGIETLDPAGCQREVFGDGLGKVIGDIPNEPADKGIAFAVGVCGTYHPASTAER